MTKPLKTQVNENLNINIDENLIMKEQLTIYLPMVMHVSSIRENGEFCKRRCY